MKYILLLLIYLFSTCLSAQTKVQTGCVKTRGRMVNGKHVPGVGLTGAVVSVKGRNAIAVKNKDGLFSFPIQGKQYMVQSVTKKDYALVDADAAPKTYQNSSNIQYFVMETPEQLLQETLEKERKIRRTLNKQLQKREDEIEELKAENKISVQKYQQLMQELYAAQKSNEKLISEMADRYAKLDYDQLDDFYRHVSNCIEEGELVKADSLLKTRGDLNSQIDEHLQQGALIQQKKEKLKQAESVHQFDKEELARRCYSYFENFKMQHHVDSAAKYIELRAKVDTLSFDYVWTCGNYFLNQRIYDKAKYYLELLVRNEYLSQVDMGMGLNDLSLCYSYMGMDSLGRETMRKSLELREELAKNEPERYTVSVALASSNYAAQNALYKNGDKELARKYFVIGMSLYEQLLRYTDFFSVNLAHVKENYAMMLYRDSLFESAEKYFLEAYQTRCVFAEKYPHYYNTIQNISLHDITNLIGNIDCDSFIATKECKMIILAAAENNKESMVTTAKCLSELYYAKNDLKKCQQYLSESNKYVEELFTSNAEKYLPDLTYNYIGTAYFYLNILNDVEVANNIANKMYEHLKKCDVYSSSGFSKEFAVSDVLVLMGDIHKNDSFYNSIDRYYEAIEVLKQVSDSTIQELKINRIQEICKYISQLYYQRGNIQKAIEFSKERLKYIKGIEIIDNEIIRDVCVAYNDLALLYLQNENFDLALPNFKQATDIIKENFVIFSDLDYVQVCFYYGLALMRVGLVAESLEIMYEAQRYFKGLPKNPQSELLINNINQLVERIKQMLNE